MLRKDNMLSSVVLSLFSIEAIALKFLGTDEGKLTISFSQLLGALSLSDASTAVAQ